MKPQGPNRVKHLLRRERDIQALKRLEDDFDKANTVEAELRINAEINQRARRLGKIERARNTP